MGRVDWPTTGYVPPDALLEEENTQPPEQLMLVDITHSMLTDYVRAGRYEDGTDGQAAEIGSALHKTIVERMQATYLGDAPNAKRELKRLAKASQGSLFAAEPLYVDPMELIDRADQLVARAHELDPRSKWFRPRGGETIAARVPVTTSDGSTRAYYSFYMDGMTQKARFEFKTGKTPRIDKEFSRDLAMDWVGLAVSGYVVSKGKRNREKWPFPYETDIPFGEIPIDLTKIYARVYPDATFSSHETPWFTNAYANKFRDWMNSTLLTMTGWTPEGSM